MNKDVKARLSANALWDAEFCQYHPNYYAKAEGSHLDFDTSHDMSAVLPTGERLKLGNFKHAAWAEYVQQCANELPKAINRLEAIEKENRFYRVASGAISEQYLKNMMDQKTSNLVLDAAIVALDAAHAYIKDLEAHEGAEGFSDSTRVLGEAYYKAARGRK